MSQKNFVKIHVPVLFIKLVTRNNIKLTPLKKIYSLERSRHKLLQNTGRFFKAITFLCLGINNIVDKKYARVTMRSLILSLWNAIASYNIIF